MPRLLLFFLMPILEMYLLIEVAGYIDALPTIGLVMLTAVIGVALLRQQGLALRAIARALHCSKTTVAALLNQERVYSRIAPWLVLEESTNPEVVAQRISMLFGERFLEQLTQACLGKCRELPAMQTSVYQVVEQLRQRFTPQELGSIAMMLSAEMGYQQYQRQRW